MAIQKKDQPTMEGNTHKQQNKSDEFVFYKIKKLHKIPKTRLGNCPIYIFFVDYNDEKGNTQRFPVCTMLDLGSTSCIISPQYPKVLKIPWV
jgi:hypothetical protein